MIKMFIVVTDKDLYNYLTNICGIDPINVIPKGNNEYNYQYKDTPSIRNLIERYHKEYNK